MHGGFQAMAISNHAPPALMVPVRSETDHLTVEIEQIWIAAYVDPTQIKKARADIEGMDFGTFAPTCVETIRSARGERRVEHPILGPYLLIALQPHQMMNWTVLHGVGGVLRVLAVDGRPLEINGHEVSRLMYTHMTGALNFTTYRSGWKSVTKNGSPVKVSTKPKRSAQEVRQARKAKNKLKNLRKIRRELDRALAVSRGW